MEVLRDATSLAAARPLETLRRVMAWGTSELQPDDGRKRRILLTNRIALVCASAAFVLAVQLALISLRTHSSFMFLVTVLLLAPCFLNRAGKTHLASGSLWLVGFTACAIYALLLPGMGLHFGMLVVMALPFLTFSADRRGGIFVCSLAAIAAFLFLAFGPVAHVSTVEGARVIEIVFPAMMLGIVAFGFMSLLYDSVRAEKRLGITLAEKADMLVVVSHDINNALASASGHVEIMEYQLENDGAVQAASLRKCATALANIANITRIARDIQLSEGRMIQLEPVDLSLVAQTLLALFEAPLRSKRLTLDVSNELGSGVRALAEPTTLTHSVLGNLVSNAIKFSFPDETIKLHLSWDVASERIRVTVADSGIGIPKDLLDALLLDGTKVSRSGTRGESGSGFGLRMAHRFVQRCGGAMRIESRQSGARRDCGTTVEIFLKKA